MPWKFRHRPGTNKSVCYQSPTAEHTCMLILKPFLPGSVWHDKCYAVRIEFQFIDMRTPFSFPSEIDAVIRFVTHVSKSLRFMKQFVLCVRLVNHRSAASGEEPSLVDHRSKGS